MGDVRRLAPGDLPAVGTVLHEAFSRSAAARGFPEPWADAAAASALAAEYAAAEPEGAMVADDGGTLVGVGFVRRRGEAATIGPLAADPPRQGVGGRLLDELVARAEAWGCQSVRLYQDAWNPDSFALYAGRSFAAIDVICALHRAAGRLPAGGGARGLEIAPPPRSAIAELAAFDARLTGLDRESDLAALVKWVARRRGALVGFLGARGSLLGPGLALDAADLGALLARALMDSDGTATARLSTAAPAALNVALALGFRVVSLGTLMVRGATHPARPPQMYSLSPEIL